MTKTIIMIGATSLLLALGSAASAQPTPPTQQTPPSQPSAPDFGQQNQPETDFAEDTIENFAEAFVGVAEVQRGLSGELQNVENRDEAMELQREAQEKMVKIVQSNDLSIDEYNRVATAMQTDPELRNRILELAGN